MKKKHYLGTIADILLIAFLLLFPHYAQLPFASYAIVCFLLILFFLKRRQKTLTDIGLKRNGITSHALVVGILSAVLWMGFVKFVYLPLINHFFADYVKTYTDYDFVKNNLQALSMVVLVAWLGGGFYEEIAFRGFIQHAVQKWFIKCRLSFWLAAIVTSILFGLYHYQQGIFGIIGATLGGLFWSWLFKRYKQNLWYSIISHGFYDTIALTMIYFDVLNN